MLIALAGLGLLVIYLASKSPEPNTDNATDLPSNTAVPALGATGAPSPAKANGAAGISKVVEVQQSVLYKLVANNVGDTTKPIQPRRGVETSFQKIPSPNINVVSPPQVTNGAFVTRPPGNTVTKNGLNDYPGLVKL